MVDNNNEQTQGQGRPPRRTGRQGGRQARPAGPRPAIANEMPAHDYGQHLEREHGLRVEAEPGYPSEVQRFRLLRPAGAKKSDQVLAVFDGTFPAAVAHFYGYLHPAGGHKRVTEPTREEAPAAAPGESSEAA